MLSFAFILFLFSFRTAECCTTFALSNSPNKVIGNTLDWAHDHGMIIFNPRNLSKASLHLDPEHIEPVEWISKYGSLTFNQAGREFPYGGINEKGLVVEIMWLNYVEYPPRDTKLPAINEVQWIQYQLDNAATVDEAIQFAKAMVVRGGFALVHYLICDLSGKCATFDHIDKTLVIHSGDELVVNALTNDSYERSLKYLSQFTRFGGEKPIPTGSDSLSRFARAALGVKNYTPNKDAVPYAFEVLTSVSQAKTVWQLVYNSELREIYFRTKRYPKIKKALFDPIDFSCSRPAKILDMNSDLEGNIMDQLQNYTDEFNSSMVDESDFIPESIRKYLKVYPKKMTKCLDK